MVRYSPSFLSNPQSFQGAKIFHQVLTVVVTIVTINIIFVVNAQNGTIFDTNFSPRISRLSVSPSSSVSSSCKNPISRYLKCAVPQFRFGNCSLQAAVDKLVTILRQSDGTFRPPPYVGISDQILKAGYLSVQHTVTNNDGYMLTSFRIIDKQKTPSNCSKPVIILQHGASTNCASWTLPSTDDAIVWGLVDAGFDLWLTCTRGTRYSTGHINSTSRGKYWDFDIDDLGRDTGTWIDYILNKDVTGCSTLTYVGHSMGTTSMFSLLSLRPEYNQKVNHYFAISAAAFQSYTTAVITPVASLECNHLLWGNLLVPSGYNINAPFPGKLGRRLYHTFVPYVCGASVAQGYFCGAVSFAAFGCEFSNTNYTMVANAIPFFLDNLSFKAYRHASQNIAMKEFCRFDYGSEKNMKIYGSCNPPCYDLSQLTTNVTVFELSNDAPVGHEDVVKLMDTLVNAKNRMVIQVPGARNHLDCLVGNNSKFYVSKIVERLGLTK